MGGEGEGEGEDQSGDGGGELLVWESHLGRGSGGGGLEEVKWRWWIGGGGLESTGRWRKGGNQCLSLACLLACLSFMHYII